MTRHRLRATPLACVPDEYWRNARSLMPAANATTIACRGHHHGDERAELFRVLQDVKCERDSATKALSVRMPPFGGWWAVTHALIKPLMHAMLEQRTLVSPMLPLWSDEASCPSRTLACFFEPLSPCDASLGTPFALHKNRNGRDVEFLSVTTAWAQSLSQAEQARKGTVHKRGWFWQVATLSSYIMRPAPSLSARFRAALNSTGLGAALARPWPVLGLHVRQGDACSSRERARTARTCDPLSEYMPAIRRLSSRLPGAHLPAVPGGPVAGGGVRTIFLATDSEEVLSQTADYPEYEWLTFKASFDYTRAVNPSNKKWDHVLKTLKEAGSSSSSSASSSLMSATGEDGTSASATAAGAAANGDPPLGLGGGAAPEEDGGGVVRSGGATNMELAMLTSIDVMLLAQCDLFVGKMTSNLFRAAYELHSGQCDCAAPFESLDSPWCFDWGVRAGGGGTGSNATFDC